jgi:hypothetical protein
MLALALLILALILFGGGFAYSVLWYVAIAVIVLALVSFLFGGRTAV